MRGMPPISSLTGEFWIAGWINVITCFHKSITGLTWWHPCLITPNHGILLTRLGWSYTILTFQPRQIFLKFIYAALLVRNYFPPYRQRRKPIAILLLLRGKCLDELLSLIRPVQTFAAKNHLDKSILITNDIPLVRRKFHLKSFLRNQYFIEQTPT